MTHVSRRVPLRAGLRITTVIVLGCATAPLLTGCAPSPGASLFDSFDSLESGEGSVRLQAADSDLLLAPTHHAFVVDSVATGRMLTSAGEESFAGPLLAAGDLSVTDGLITQATISVTAPSLANVVFSLTEPVLLRRDGAGTEAFAAVGTLTFGEIERANAEIMITPSLSAEGGSITASMSLPEGFLLSDTPDPGSLEVTVAVQPGNPAEAE